MKIPTVTQEIASTVYPQEYVAYSRENFVTRTHVEMVMSQVVEGTSIHDATPCGFWEGTVCEGECAVPHRPSLEATCSGSGCPSLAAQLGIFGFPCSATGSTTADLIVE